ncbi:MAG: hypothetical protein ACP5I7_02120 [Sulfolobales archaeon]
MSAEPKYFKVEKTKRGVSIKNVSEKTLEIVSVAINYSYTIMSSRTSVEESLRTEFGKKYSKETIYVGKNLSPGELIEIEFYPPEIIESVEIYYGEPGKPRESISVKP